MMMMMMMMMCMAEPRLRILMDLFGNTSAILNYIVEIMCSGSKLVLLIALSNNVIQNGRLIVGKVHFEYAYYLP